MAKERKNKIKEVKEKAKDINAELPLDMPANSEEGTIHFPPQTIELEITNYNSDETIEKKEEFVSNVVGTFSKEKPIFLQIHTGNVYTIFGSGIISPANYVTNRAFTDFQTIIAQGFILSNGIISSGEEPFLLIELNFTNEELNHVAINECYGFYFKPIPISRIIRIYSGTDKSKNEIVSTAISNDGGIIPKRLVKGYYPKGLAKENFKKYDGIGNNQDFSDKLIQYDKILGTFAYIKNFSILTANRTNALASLPDHYFYAIQALNNNGLLGHLKNERAVAFYRQLFQPKDGIESPLLKWLFNRINTQHNFTDEDIQQFGVLLFSEAKSKEFAQQSKVILESLSKSIERKKAIAQILLLNDADKFYLYLFAFLRLYGNVNNESKSISRIDIPELSTSYSEYVFSVLGYFYGYKSLRNFDDRLNLKDKVFSEYVGPSNRFPIKFELDTEFDYITIESVYSNVFNSGSTQIHTSFIKADSLERQLVIKPRDMPTDYTFSFNLVCGKFYYLFKRKVVVDELTPKLNSLPSQVPVISEVGILCYRSKIPFSYISFGELLKNPTRISYFIHFNKEDIIAAVKSNKINGPELLQRMELSNLHKEF